MPSAILPQTPVSPDRSSCTSVVDVPSLVFLITTQKSENRNKVFTCHTDKPIKLVIGRASKSAGDSPSPKNGLYHSEVMSKRHVHMECGSMNDNRYKSKNRWLKIQDLGSTHGTWIQRAKWSGPKDDMNKFKLTRSQEAYVGQGDLITFGKTVQGNADGKVFEPLTVRIHFALGPVPAPSPPSFTAERYNKFLPRGYPVLPDGGGASKAAKEHKGRDVRGKQDKRDIDASPATASARGAVREDEVVVVVESDDEMDDGVKAISVASHDGSEVEEDGGDGDEAQDQDPDFEVEVESSDMDQDSDEGEVEIDDGEELEIEAAAWAAEVEEGDVEDTDPFHAVIGAYDTDGEDDVDAGDDSIVNRIDPEVAPQGTQTQSHDPEDAEGGSPGSRSRSLVLEPALVMEEKENDESEEVAYSGPAMSTEVSVDETNYEDCEENMDVSKAKDQDRGEEDEEEEVSQAHEQHGNDGHGEFDVVTEGRSRIGFWETVSQMEVTTEEVKAKVDIPVRSANGKESEMQGVGKETGAAGPSDVGGSDVVGPSNADPPSGIVTAGDLSHKLDEVDDKDAGHPDRVVEGHRISPFAPAFPLNSANDPIAEVDRLIRLSDRLVPRLPSGPVYPFCQTRPIDPTDRTEFFDTYLNDIQGNRQKRGLPRGRLHSVPLAGEGHGHTSSLSNAVAPSVGSGDNGGPSEKSFIDRMELYRIEEEARIRAAAALEGPSNLWWGRAEAEAEAEAKAARKAQLESERVTKDCEAVHGSKAPGAKQCPAATQPSSSKKRPFSETDGLDDPYPCTTSSAVQTQPRNSTSTEGVQTQTSDNQTTDKSTETAALAPPPAKKQRTSESTFTSWKAIATAAAVGAVLGSVSTFAGLVGVDLLESV